MDGFEFLFEFKCAEANADSFVLVIAANDSFVCKSSPLAGERHWCHQKSDAASKELLSQVRDLLGGNPYRQMKRCPVDWLYCVSQVHVGWSEVAAWQECCWWRTMR